MQEWAGKDSFINFITAFSPQKTFPKQF